MDFAEQWQLVFPARAGMILPALTKAPNHSSIPRESGDDPVQDLSRDLADVYSPRERG